MSDEHAVPEAPMVEFTIGGQTISVPLLRWVDAKVAKMAAPDFIAAVDKVLDAIAALLPADHELKKTGSARTLLEESLGAHEALPLVNKYNELLRRSGMLPPEPQRPVAVPDASKPALETESPNFPGVELTKAR